MSSPLVDLASQPLRNLCRISNFSRVTTPAAIPGWNTFGAVNAAVETPPVLDWNDTPIPGLPSFKLTVSSAGSGPVSRKTVTPDMVWRTGQKTFFSGWIKCSKAVSVQLYWEGTMADGTTYAGGGLTLPGTVTLTPNVWTRLAMVYVAPSTIDGRILKSFGLLMNNGSATVTPILAAGDTVSYVTLDCIPDLAVDPGIHVDGDSPGWQWRATAGASESVGYPYTIESLGGPLAGVSINSPAFVSLPVLPPFAGRTLYVVYDITDTADAYPTMAQAWGTSGGSTDGRMAIFHENTGVNTSFGRIDTAGTTGVQNQTIPVAGARTAGRHVAAVTLADGLTTGTVGIDGALQATKTNLVSGSGFTSTAPVLSLNQTVGKAVAAYAFPREHNRETMTRIMGWLARKHAAPLPLDEVAGGKSLADLAVPGVVALNQPVSTDPITLYLVGNRLTDAAVWNDNHGINALGSGFSRGTGLAIQQIGSSTWGWQYRVDTLASGLGFNQAATNVPGAALAGAHVFAVRLNAGMTARVAFLDGAMVNTNSMTTNAGVEVYELRMTAASSSFTPLRLVAFRAEHDTTTVARVSAWLARRYGAPIPAGY